MATIPTGVKAKSEFRPITGNRQRLIFPWFAPKHSGKSSGPTTIPKRPETKHYILTADNNTENGIEMFHAKRFASGYPQKPFNPFVQPGPEHIKTAKAWMAENVVVLPILDAYEESQPESTEAASEYGLDLARWVRDQTNIAGLIVEHFPRLHDPFGADLVRAGAGLPKENNLMGIDMRLWMPRTAFCRAFLGAVFDAKSDFLCFADYPEKAVSRLVKVDGKAKMVETFELPAAYEKYNVMRDAKFRLDCIVDVSRKKVGNEDVENTTYLAKVAPGSQFVHMPDGLVANITGHGLGSMFQADWYYDIIGMKKVVA